MSKDYTFLNTVLAKSDLRDFSFSNDLSEDDLKQAQPYTLMRWFSSIGDKLKESEHQLLSAQILNNKTPPNDRRLVLKMVASAGCGKVLKHQWINPIVRRQKKINKKHLEVQKLLELNDIELDIFIKEKDDLFFDAVLDYYGYQDSEIKKISK